jgi:hypothetical protein
MTMGIRMATTITSPRLQPSLSEVSSLLYHTVSWHDCMLPIDALQVHTSYPKFTFVTHRILSRSQILSKSFASDTSNLWIHCILLAAIWPMLPPMCAFHTNCPDPILPQIESALCSRRQPARRRHFRRQSGNVARK